MKDLENYKHEMEKLGAFLTEANNSPVNDKSSFILPALRKSQELFSCIPEFVQEVIATEFNIDKEEVLNVIDAYPYLTTGVVADTRVSICCGPVCYRKGSMEIHDKLRKKVNLESGCDITPDNSLSVKMTHCKGHCRQAPMATINSKPYYAIEEETFCDRVIKRVK